MTKMMSKSVEVQVAELIGKINSDPTYHGRDSLCSKLGYLLEDSDASSNLLHDVAQLNLGMEVNNSIAKAPRVSLETLAILCGNARHRWEWRSLSHAYEAALKPISNYSAIFENQSISVRDSAEFVLNIRHELTSILWQELATHQLLTFYYRQDTSDGDHFGPEDFDLEHSPAEYLISPGYEVDWVTRDEYLDSEYVAQRLEEEWGTWDATIDKIGALYFGSDAGHLEPIGENIYREVYQELESVGVMEDQFIVTDVEPDLPKIKQNLKKANYESLPDLVKHEIVEHLIATLNHPFLGGFKISQHLLALLLIHPATPDESKALISSLSERPD
jgi:hypothetical protein